MSDEVVTTGTLESPPTSQEPEPEGTQEIQGQKMAPVSAIVAERERVRNTERERAAKEREVIEQRASAAEQEAQRLRAEVEAIREAHRPKPVDIPDVSDQEAEHYARQYELYTPNGLDVNRAKRMIAANRDEIKRIAAQAAQEAVKGPQEEVFRQASKQNFIWAANQRGPNGQPLVDPRALAEQWALLPAELTAKPEVAQHLLKTVAGDMLLSGKQPPAAPQYEPTFTETPGGRRPGYQMSNIEKTMARATGMSEKDFAERAKSYQPGVTNFLE